MTPLLAIALIVAQGASRHLKATVSVAELRAHPVHKLKKKPLPYVEVPNRDRAWTDIFQGIHNK